MTSLRALSAALLLAGLVVAAPGCGNKPGPAQAEKKDESKKDDAQTKGDKTDPKGGTVVEPKSSLGQVEPAADRVATDFLKDLGQGTAKADALSPAFLKAVGRPLELPDDIKSGVSRDAAARWLRTVGEHNTFTPALFRQQAGDAVLWHGSVIGPGKSGGYSLRLARLGGEWKVDWLGLSSVSRPRGTEPGSADAAFQEFAVASFAETLGDANVMADAARPAALAHLLTPDLRKAWAGPGAQDAAQGYDYSPGNLRLAAIKHGGGTKDFAVARTGELTYTVTLNKPAGGHPLAVKLVKGTAPGEWLVTEAK
ncbi:MAG: hypothetical protein ACKODX_07120 [Gemmata sp.]